MQFNPGVTTIEGLLEKAMVAAGAISADNAGEPRKVHWMRAARTDKGVSAIGQVVSLKMMVEPEGVIERINAALPPQVRAFGYAYAPTPRLTPPCELCTCAVQRTEIPVHRGATH